MFGSWPNVHRWALPSADRPLPVVRPGHGQRRRGSQHHRRPAGGSPGHGRPREFV